MEFARWLKAHGYLDEWCERHADPMGQNMLHLDPGEACDLGVSE